MTTANNSPNNTPKATDVLVMKSQLKRTVKLLDDCLGYISILQTAHDELNTKIDSLNTTINTLVDIVNTTSIQTSNAHNRIDELEARLEISGI